MDRRLFLLGLTLVLGPLFMVVSGFAGTNEYDLFLFSDQKLTIQTWLYFLVEHVVLLILCFLLVLGEKQHRTILIVYALLEAADTLDYLLTYNSVWFTTGIPISMNILKVVIFGYYVFRYGRTGSY